MGEKAWADRRGEDLGMGGCEDEAGKCHSYLSAPTPSTVVLPPPQPGELFSMASLPYLPVPESSYSTTASHNFAILIFTMFKTYIL